MLKNIIREKEKKLFLFDVESDGLYGDGFAVAVIVYNTFTATIVDEINLLVSNFTPECEFVKENIMPAINSYKNTFMLCKDKKELRDKFFNFYLKYKDNSIIVSDCNYPVETNFLTAVATDNLQERAFVMPYPLFDLCNVIDIDLSRLKESGIDAVCHLPYDDCLCSLLTLLKYTDFDQYRELLKKI